MNLRNIGRDLNFENKLTCIQNLLRKSQISKIKAGFDFLGSPNTTAKNNYGYYGHTKLKALTNYFVGVLKKKSRSNYIDKNLSHVIDR